MHKADHGAPNNGCFSDQKYKFAIRGNLISAHTRMIRMHACRFWKGPNGSKSKPNAISFRFLAPSRWVVNWAVRNDLVPQGAFCYLQPDSRIRSDK